MDPKVQEQLNEQEIKIEQILQSVKKTEKYMKWTFWTTMIVDLLGAGFREDEEIGWLILRFYRCVDMPDIFDKPLKIF